MTLTNQYRPVISVKDGDRQFPVLMTKNIWAGVNPAQTLY